MIVTKDNQQLYPRSFVYNACRIMSKLSKIVVNNGGMVKDQNNSIIVNLSLLEAIRETKERINEIEKAISNFGENENRLFALDNCKKDLLKYKSINNDPINVTHTTYITFIHDNIHYYYRVDDNPFFPFYYHKTPIVNGKRSLDACMDEDEKTWLYDCFFGFGCSNDDIVEASHLIYNMLINAKMSIIRPDTSKQRVPNTYNNGYHIETISKPRFEKVEF